MPGKAQLARRCNGGARRGWLSLLLLLSVSSALLLSGCEAPLQMAPSASARQVTDGQVEQMPPATATPTSQAQPRGPALPVRLLIPSIGVAAAVESVGLTAAGMLATPQRHPWDDVGWYSLGPRPGEQGSAVIAGHLDRPGGYPAVFWNLHRLHAGAAVIVIDAHGQRWFFRVTGVASYPPQRAPLLRIFADRSGRYLNLITCAGTWIPSEHQTSERLVVYSVLQGA
ncbi:class F sortase [Thermogemmatispora sp.]|uniref:class F sortase n=1 Tax=Thermogemmatispora sp. TaxID=1968838 RepID=UPI001D2A2B1F|nr:class F sortase [Thermogemmatispora sp.]MBX5449007.1 class F sortase [Thermogemmatispora sp.]